MGQYQEDNIDRHMGKVKSQPYFGQVYNTINDPGEVPKMSLGLQARSNLALQDKSIIKPGYPQTDPKKKNVKFEYPYSMGNLENKEQTYEEVPLKKPTNHRSSSLMRAGQS